MSRDRVEPLRFSIPFRPCSKKNERKPTIVSRKGRKPVLGVRETSRCEAHQDAIAALALVELAWRRGRIGAGDVELFRELATARQAENLTRDALEIALARLRGRAGPAFGRELVRLELLEHVGRRKGEDWLEVRVSLLEDELEPLDRSQLQASLSPAGPDGPRRTKRQGTDHDLVNLPAIVCDALEGIAYENDRQVAALDVRRVLD